MIGLGTFGSELFGKMAGIVGTIYNTIFKRTSTFVLAVIGSAFVFERTLDLGVEVAFEKINEGVSHYITVVLRE